MLLIPSKIIVLMTFGLFNFAPPQVLAPSGTAVPDLQRADPRQGISRRSCMLMRRILLKVGRGVRRRISQLGSCLHPPGADQSSVKHSVSNAFLLSHDSSNQLHHSMFCDRGFLTWSRSKQRQAFRVQCVSTFGTVLTNLYESLLLLSSLAYLRQFWVLFTPAACGPVFTPQASAKVLARAPSTTQKCPRVHVPLGLPNCSFFRLTRDIRRRFSRL